MPSVMTRLKKLLTRFLNDSIKVFEFLNYCSQYMAGPMQHVHIYMVTSSLYESDREKALSFSFIKGFREKPLSKEIVTEMHDLMLQEKARQQ
jgi:hypothetical protein